MALRDQPYLPLYVQDFLTDEKLMECSASATGVYIRLMCIMHKSETYGTILLKQKDKQNSEQILNFAYKVAKFLPYDLPTTVEAIKELLAENVIEIDGDLLIQKRMLKDGRISDKRSLAGAKGGKTTTKKYKYFAKAKNQANAEDEYDNENEDEIDNNGKESVREKPKKFIIPTVEEISNYCLERKNSVDAQNFFDFYQSKGWKIGKNQMKDWKASVRTWEKNNNSNKTQNDGSGKQITGKQQFRFNSADAISSITGQTK